MKKLFVIAHFAWLIVWIIPTPPGSWASTTEAIVTESDQIAGAPPPPTPSQENPQGLNQNDSRWGNEYLQQAPHLYDFSKNPIQLSHGSAIPLKSPGTFPGIELGVENA